MTYHIKIENFSCQKCSFLYIPFKKGYTCPSCDNVAESKQYLEFIDNLSRSMIAHKQQYGSFYPGAWYINSLTEQVQAICFQIFDEMEAKQPLDKKSWILYKVETFDDYDVSARRHIKDIIIEVYARYMSENAFLKYEISRYS